MGDVLDELFGLLKRLTEAFGVSGYEDDVRGVVIDELRGVADSVEVDSLGNVIAVKKGEGGLRLLLDAHMDEIGFFVRYIDERGFVYLSPIGGWWDPIVLGQRVRIRTDDGRLVYGVVGSKPPHLLKPEEREKVVPLDRLFVDIGASSREEVESLGIRVGSPVDLDRDTIRLAGDRVTGKAMDDRAGVAALISAFKAIDGQEADVYLVVATQEEVGLKGARVAAYRVAPHVGIAVDVTTANDVPGAEARDQVARVGGGPALTVADGRSSSGLISHPKLLKLLLDTAREAGIPVQLSILPGGTTDGAVIALTREGVPTATVSIPTRYIHSPVELLSLRDLEYTSRLIVEATKRVTKEWYEANIGPLD